jgi:hypothetical protein
MLTTVRIKNRLVTFSSSHREAFNIMLFDCLRKVLVTLEVPLENAAIDQLIKKHLEIHIGSLMHRLTTGAKRDQVDKLPVTTKKVVKTLATNKVISCKRYVEESFSAFITLPVEQYSWFFFSSSYKKNIVRKNRVFARDFFRVVTRVLYPDKNKPATPQENYFISGLD